MPPPLFQGNCQYSALVGAGTSTVNPAQGTGSAIPTAPAVYYGFNIAVLGTTPAATVYDVYVAGTATVTNVIGSGTGTAAGQQFPAASGGLGIRLKGNLVVVTTGTAATIDVLWD